MYIFKTSAETFESVIKNQKHAFLGKPKDWAQGELILVSKNKSGLKTQEKQISYTMLFNNVRKVRPGEMDSLWPGNEGRWEYIVECTDVKKLKKPFDLEDVIGSERAKKYGPIITAGKIQEKDANVIYNKISSMAPKASVVESTKNNYSEPSSINFNSKKASKISVWIAVPLIIIAFIIGAMLF